MFTLNVKTNTNGKMRMFTQVFDKIDFVNAPQFKNEKL